MTLFGPQWPLSIGKKDTFKVYEDLESQIGYYLKSLILTSPGENISDPGYGVGIRSYLFEMNGGGTISSLRSKIRSQILTYMPYIILGDVMISDSSSELDSNTLNVVIKYSIPGDVTQTVFQLDIAPENKIGFY